VIRKLRDKITEIYYKYTNRIKMRIYNWRGLKSEMTGFNRSYIGIRWDILELVPVNVKKVLDVGCSIGTIGEALKQKIEGAEVVGIEFDAQMAEVAKSKLSKVITADVEKINLSEHFPSRYFDCIIFADILEHLRNPWDVLKSSVSVLSDNGLVIMSIPNVCHYSTIFQLIFKGYWPYRDRGIHDRTHLRFFTLKNIKEMLKYANLEPVKIKKRYRIIEAGHWLNVFSILFALPVINRFLTFQYLVCAKARKDR